MYRIFVKSYEDGTYLGRDVAMGRLVEEVIAGSKFPLLGFDEAVEFLKRVGTGDFVFCESIEAVKELDGFVITGE